MKRESIRNLIAIVLALFMLLSACGSRFTCDLCNRNCRGEKYDLTGWGRGYVCETCYDRLWGRG